MRLTYIDGRTGLTTAAFRYKLTDAAGTLVKDWTTGATWTEEPAGTYYLDDAAAVAGTYYAVEPATGQVGGVGRVPVDALDATATAAAAATGADAALTAYDPPTRSEATSDKAEVVSAIQAAGGNELGTDKCTLTFVADGGSAHSDLRVRISADAAGTVRSPIKVTNSVGQVDFDLTDGETFYAWRYSGSVAFADNPVAFVAVADAEV